MVNKVFLIHAVERTNQYMRSKEYRPLKYNVVIGRADVIIFLTANIILNVI